MVLLNYHSLVAGLLLLMPVAGKSQVANRFDIIIDELMADPSPVIGLPGSEFIELKNNSAVAYSLQNWKLGDGTATAIITNNFILQPGEYVIICAGAAVAAFSNYGNVVGVSNFPSLNNDHDQLILYSPEGRIVHAIEYDAAWYQNDVKREGGWTLEMIDTQNPCSGMNNWKASTDPAGGTPGRKNAVDEINLDETPPTLLRTYTIDSTTIIAVFDEPLDSFSAATISNYHLDNGMGQPLSSIPLAPFYSEVALQFSSSLSSNTVYQLTVSNIADCSANIIGAMNKTTAGLPVLPEYFDVVINEILFNPSPGGHDFIELYNRSNKTFDLRDVYICNRNATGNFTNIIRLTELPILFFPGEYRLAVEKMALPGFPSMPDDMGHIAIINLQGDLIDGLRYDKKWHFALIDNDEGISLERINYNDSTQNNNNWTSASNAAGFATPGYQNSQFRQDLSAQGLVTVSPTIFSPDNSGVDDFATITCRLAEPGFMVNITIYDDKGRRVRHLVRNAIAGITSSFRWDGLDEQQKKLPVGNYIIVTEMLNLQGKTKKFKQVIALARIL